MPKSTTFTKSVSPSTDSRKTFAGLRSRWTIPFACVADSADATCRMMWLAAGADILPMRARRFSRSSPSRNSITR